MATNCDTEDIVSSAIFTFIVVFLSQFWRGMRELNSRSAVNSREQDHFANSPERSTLSRALRCFQDVSLFPTTLGFIVEPRNAVSDNGRYNNTLLYQGGFTFFNAVSTLAGTGYGDRTRNGISALFAVKGRCPSQLDEPSIRSGLGGSHGPPSRLFIHDFVVGLAYFSC